METDPNSLINMDHLYDISEGQPKEMRKLSQMYIRAMEDYLRKLRLAVIGARSAQVAAVAHAAAGASSFMGVGGMALLLRKLERLGRQGDAERAKNMMPELENLFQQVSQFLIQQNMQVAR